MLFWIQPHHFCISIDYQKLPDNPIDPLYYLWSKVRRKNVPSVFFKQFIFPFFFYLLDYAHIYFRLDIAKLWKYSKNITDTSREYDSQASCNQEMLLQRIRNWIKTQYSLCCTLFLLSPFVRTLFAFYSACKFNSFREIRDLITSEPQTATRVLPQIKVTRTMLSCSDKRLILLINY